MIREAYKFAVAENGFPFVEKVEITDPEGVSWREAKKQLRQWYLDQAAALRAVNEKTYFS